MEIFKNRDRKEYSFANINLLGKCNAKCYFCLGKDIEQLLSLHDQTKVHFKDWKNFDKFVAQCRENKIRNIYVTGQNVDSLQYRYLDELVDHLQVAGFDVGLRTNGLLAEKNLDTINKMRRNAGYSIHSLRAETLNKIMGWKKVPNWNYILKHTDKCRVSIVVNRFNAEEFWEILEFLSQYPSVKYVQARRICTDTRLPEHAEDIEVYEQMYGHFARESREGRAERLPDFYSAQRFALKGKEVCFWRTVETTVNSLNFFSDGTLSDQYFIVEGYLKNQLCGQGGCRKEECHGE